MTHAVRLAAALLALMAAVPALSARIERTQATTTLPGGRSVLSPYVNPRSGELVLHVQPAQASAQERLVDARSGQPWSGDLGGVLRDFQHLGTESIADVASGSAPDLALLRSLGCTRQHVICTSAQDAEVLLFAAPSGRDGLALTVIDLGAVAAEFEELLAGRKAGSELDWGDDEWRALDVLGSQPDRRARWVSAVRGITDIDAFQRLLGSATQGPRLGARPLFSGANPAFDLRAELELLGHRLLVGTHASQLLAGGGPAAASRLADALVSATQPPNQIGVATHLVDLLADRPEPQRQQLAQALQAEASRRRSEVLRCFAQWVQVRPCGDGAPPWVQRDTSVAAAPPAPMPPRRDSRPAPAPVPAPVPAPAPATPIAAGGVAGDAPHEWTLIQTIPNKLVLVAFNESSGRMVPDRAVVGGFSFIARALGPVEDGRFELEMATQPGAPVKLRHGQYRVRAKLALDYTREDQCVQGMSCWFSRPELHAKSVPREVVFFMTVGGHFTDRRRVEFGALLPLQADGNGRYRSQLKEARLAIESVRFELL